MPHFLPDIWEQVRDDVRHRRVVDVDAYCRRFAPLHPELTRKDVQDIVLDAAGTYGGVAIWGSDNPPHSTG